MCWGINPLVYAVIGEFALLFHFLFGDVISDIMS